MRLKTQGSERIILSPFDLEPKTELALSKSFAFLLTKSEYAYNRFLKLLPVMRTEDNCHYQNVEIAYERRRKEGRTDIEIESAITHIIVECKIGGGQPHRQLTQYLPSFSLGKKGVMCFITQERGLSKLNPYNDIEYKFLLWRDIITHFNNKNDLQHQLIKDFVTFANRRYTMSAIKEILIQDLGNKREIERFREHYIYRRDLTFGAPLYFAPYFTRTAEQIEGEGIFYLSKVLGVLNIKNPETRPNVSADLASFTSDKDLIASWESGIYLPGANHPEDATYYFLDKPFKFNPPLKKGGRGQKGWIGSQIPKNRTVGFADFLRNMPSQK